MSVLLSSKFPVLHFYSNFAVSRSIISLNSQYFSFHSMLKLILTTAVIFLSIEDVSLITGSETSVESAMEEIWIWFSLIPLLIKYCLTRETLSENCRYASGSVGTWYDTPAFHKTKSDLMRVRVAPVTIIASVSFCVFAWNHPKIKDDATNQWRAQRLH